MARKRAPTTHDIVPMPSERWLWANLLLERQLFPPGAQRHAFELGFLSRIHQRLCSPLGGEHQARRTELQL
ncbi:hypothetical protein N619_32320 [Ectopseudomonas oleovorans]|nr:hypothetical protein N619_32320 [Pseudomonas oleovorans]